MLCCRFIFQGKFNRTVCIPSIYCSWMVATYQKLLYISTMGRLLYMAGTIEITSAVNLETCTAILIKEWIKRYKKVFKIDIDFKDCDCEKIKEMILKWGYERTFIKTMSTVRFYPDKWRNEMYKWLSVNQVYTWIGYEMWMIYKNKEFTVRIVRPNGVVTNL